jgi:hypothetical protein
LVECRSVEILYKKINGVSNLDESIGKLLLELQKNDPDTFKKLMKQAQKENPELFDNVDEDNKEVEEYNQKIEEYNQKIEDE